MYHAWYLQYSDTLVVKRDHSLSTVKCQKTPLHARFQAFFPALAFFLASLMVTLAKNNPIPVIPSKRSAAGRRTAHSLAGNKEWRDEFGSRKGWESAVIL